MFDHVVKVTIRNIAVCWDQHNNQITKLNPSKHIEDDLDKVFNWSVLANTSKNMYVSKKNPKGVFTDLEKHTLNEQLEPDKT